MWWLPLLLNITHAQVTIAPDVLDKIQITRAGISEDERIQREALSRLFVINKNVKDMAQKQERINQHMLAQEANVRTLAQDVQILEVRSDQQKGMLRSEEHTSELQSRQYLVCRL